MLWIPSLCQAWLTLSAMPPLQVISLFTARCKCLVYRKSTRRCWCNFRFHLLAQQSNCPHDDASSVVADVWPGIPAKRLEPLVEASAILHRDGDRPPHISAFQALFGAGDDKAKVPPQTCLCVAHRRSEVPQLLLMLERLKVGVALQDVAPS